MNLHSSIIGKLKLEDLQSISLKLRYSKLMIEHSRFLLLHSFFSLSMYLRDNTACLCYTSITPASECSPTSKKTVSITKVNLVYKSRLYVVIHSNFHCCLILKPLEMFGQTLHRRKQFPDRWVALIKAGGLTSRHGEDVVTFDKRTGLKMY